MGHCERRGASYYVFTREETRRVYEGWRAIHNRARGEDDARPVNEGTPER